MPDIIAYNKFNATFSSRRRRGPTYVPDNGPQLVEGFPYNCESRVRVPRADNGWVLDGLRFGVFHNYHIRNFSMLIDSSVTFAWHLSFLGRCVH